LTSDLTEEFDDKWKAVWVYFRGFVSAFGIGRLCPPPEAEKQAAKGAMDAAVSSGADKYAVADLDAAKKVWETAESQMNAKKYKEAKQSYIDAKAAFEKARGAVEAGKKAASDEASVILVRLRRPGNNWKPRLKHWPNK